MLDLPMQTAEQRRAYRRFRSELKKAGFCALQESIYVCLLRNTSSAVGMLNLIDRIAPREGSVQALPMSLQTFRAMTALRGFSFDMGVFSDDFIVISD